MKESFAEVSRNDKVTSVTTGPSLAAVIDTVNVAFVVAVPSVTVTVYVSDAFAERALIAVLFGANEYAPVAFVTVRVPYVPVDETVAVALVTDRIP